MLVDDFSVILVIPYNIHSVSYQYNTAIHIHRTKNIPLLGF
ncbi:hypothetical protein VCRA217O17_20429 [Vibrio crassostreae]|nr:hypothetical protein VCRA217O17_20429 [Vibrio crassostreae]